jgi:peptide-methionine (S)-S-oxide reductase
MQHFLLTGLLLAGSEWFWERKYPMTQEQTAPAKEKASAPVETATFAGGCFWGVEHFFAAVPGVISAEVGYMGGTTENPTYKRVCQGDTNHAEVVHLRYDPNQVSFESLVNLFFKMHDPTTLNRQGPDAGTQYRSAIFFHSEQQKDTARSVINQLTQKRAFKRPIVTQVVPAGPFWRAEEYHQDYFDKNPGHSCHINFSPSMLE